MLTKYIILFLDPHFNNENGNGLVITKDNSVYYFNLYLDNELGETERKAVENFVEQNPEHQDVFHSMQKAYLKPQKFAFDKTKLYKQTIITAENLTSYFLLHIDKELNKEEEIQLQEYLKLHPEKAAVLNDLIKTKLEPETVSFGKSLLLKPNNETAYESLFLLYFDNECSIEEKALVEQIIAKDPLQYKIFSQLKASIISPEKISFPNKEKLLKREKAPVLFLANILKYAAILVLVAGISWYFLISKNKPNKEQQPQQITHSSQLDKGNQMAKVDETKIMQPTLEKAKILSSSNQANQANQVEPETETIAQKQINEIIKTSIKESPQNSIARNDSQLLERDNLALNKKIITVENRLPLDNKITVNKEIAIEQNNRIINPHINEDVSVFNVAIEDIDKKSILPNWKTKLNNFINKKKKAIANSSISIGNYELAFNHSK